MTTLNCKDLGGASEGRRLAENVIKIHNTVSERNTVVNV